MGTQDPRWRAERKGAQRDKAGYPREADGRWQPREDVSHRLAPGVGHKSVWGGALPWSRAGWTDVPSEATGRSGGQTRQAWQAFVR